MFPFWLVCIVGALLALLMLALPVLVVLETRECRRIDRERVERESARLADADRTLREWYS